MDGRHGGKTPREDPPLKCQGPGHDPLVIGYLGINVDLVLPLDTPPVGLISNLSGNASLGAGVESTLVASSNEA